jgi:hypothetical protein
MTLDDDGEGVLNPSDGISRKGRDEFIRPVHVAMMRLDMLAFALEY